jgi:phospho-N-acetylmuramoyl-pentapeptide-transferase
VSDSSGHYGGDPFVGRPFNRYIQLAAFVVLFFGAIGFVDDYSKVTGKNRNGMSASTKFTLQIIGALVVATRALFLP